jgi:hypothetical protein
MPLYIKSLTLNQDRNLVSCHGGNAVWEFSRPTADLPEGEPRTVYVKASTVEIPALERGRPCAKGALHALRIRDLPFWLGTHYAVVEMSDARVHENKVYGYDQQIIRIADFDGLDMLVRFAEYCASQGEKYNDNDGAQWIAAQFPKDFLEGVEA